MRSSAWSSRASSSRADDVAELARGVRSGAGRALGRALSLVERGDETCRLLVRELHAGAGRARTIGVTGAPGVGKSSLLEMLGSALLGGGESVAVLAVDPSSPFSGGAVLGDRVRMTGLTEAGGFVRSMATRGALGGLCAATADALVVLDAAGFGSILVETVGVGQDEVDVAGEVDTVVVVTAPGLGDDVQAAKAGVLEVADILVVNKADRPGADAQAALLEDMVSLRGDGGWVPPVLRTTALTGEGLAELRAALSRHVEYLERGGRRAELRRRRVERRLGDLVGALLRERLRGDRAEEFARVVASVGAGAVDPYSAARSILAGLVKEEG